jgi:hypothetical protein
MTLKIRGIYATALTKFFVDHGRNIVSPSPVIAGRFDDQVHICNKIIMISGIASGQTTP